MRRPPDLVLGVDERVGVADAQLAEHVGVGAVRHAVSEHQLAVALGELGVVAAETRSMPGDEQLVVPGELDERVAPVEEDGLDHSPG